MSQQFSCPSFYHVQFCINIFRGRWSAYCSLNSFIQNRPWKFDKIHISVCIMSLRRLCYPFCAAIFTFRECACSHACLMISSQSLSTCELNWKCITLWNLLSSYMTLEAHQYQKAHNACVYSANIVHVKDWQAEKANEEVSAGWFDYAQANVKCVVGVVLLYCVD